MQQRRLDALHALECTQHSSKAWHAQQVFLKDQDGNHEFVGDWNEFEGLLDSDGLPAEVRA